MKKWKKTSVVMAMLLALSLAATGCAKSSDSTDKGSNAGSSTNGGTAGSGTNAGTETSGKLAELTFSWW